MTTNGTAMYDEFADHSHVPALVLDAVALARRRDFTHTVHPRRASCSQRWRAA